MVSVAVFETTDNLFGCLGRMFKTGSDRPVTRFSQVSVKKSQFRIDDSLRGPKMCSKLDALPDLSCHAVYLNALGDNQTGRLPDPTG